MPDRRARLLAALEIADIAPPEIDRADAAGWVAAQIMARPSGQATVLYHSIVWPYLNVSQRFAIESAFAQAAEEVRPDAPLVWLKWMAANWARLHSFLIAYGPAQRP